MLIVIRHEVTLTPTLYRALRWSVLAVIALVILVVAEYSFSTLGLHSESGNAGVSFRLLDIWSVDRVDTPAAAGGRFLLKAAAWILPWPLIVQFIRVWRRRAERATGGRRLIQRFIAMGILAVILSASVTVAINDFILWVPYTERLVGEALSDDVRALMMHESLWWLGVSVFAVSLAIGVCFLSGWTWGRSHATTSHGV